MKGKLLTDAGELSEGATVDIVAKDPAEDVDGVPSPVYAVRDDAGHEERVDTRDLKPLP